MSPAHGAERRGAIDDARALELFLEMLLSERGAAAHTVDGYVELMQASGLKMLHQVDTSIEGIKIPYALEAKLGAFTAWQKMTGQQGPDPEMLERGPELLTTLRGLIQQGPLGYWIFVAEKPSV